MFSFRSRPRNTTTEMFSNFGMESNNESKENEEQIDYRQYDDENGESILDRIQNNSNNLLIIYRGP